MQFQLLGNTGVFVSRLCFGAMTFGGKATMFEAIGALGQKEADTLVGQTIDGGINFFDTANVYAAGESETMTRQGAGREAARRGAGHQSFRAHGRRGRMKPGFRGCISCGRPRKV